MELAALNPARRGEYRVFNQFTETFSVLELARIVQKQARRLGLEVEVNHIENPRVELEQHYYNPVHVKLLDLGLQPHSLSDVLILDILKVLQPFVARVKREIILPKRKWREEVRELKRKAAAASVGTVTS